MKIVLMIMFSLNVAFMEIQGQTLTAATGFTLQGYAINLEGDYLHLSYIDEKGTERTDSTKVLNGEYRFAGKIKGPTAARLTLESSGSSSALNTLYPIFLEPAELKLIIKRDMFPSSKMQGSQVHDAYWHHEKTKAELYKQMEPLQKNVETLTGIGTKEVSKSDSTKDQLELLKHQVLTLDKKYIESFPRSYLTAYLVALHLPALTLGEIEKYFSLMPPVIQKSQFGLLVSEAIQKDKSTK
jgi:hypothetical protein